MPSFSPQHTHTTNPFDSGYFETEQLRQFGFKSVGENVRIAQNCTIIGLQNITLGNNIRIDGFTTIAAYSGSLTVGNYVHIGGGCHLACAGHITLEDFSGLSQGVKIYSCSDDYSGLSLTNPTVPAEYLNVQKAPVTLKRHVIIGAGSVILPDVTIGKGVAVGALSLVTSSLAEWKIYAGIPARAIKNRNKKLLEKESSLMSC